MGVNDRAAYWHRAQQLIDANIITMFQAEQIARTGHRKEPYWTRHLLDLEAFAEWAATERGLALPSETEEESVNHNALVPGSLGALAHQNNVSIAESFLSADVLILCDTSSSMAACDSRGGRSRYGVELEELADLQARLPGKIAVMSFSSTTLFCPGGQPVNQGGGTDLAGALEFARVADVPGMRFIVISDGIPDDQGRALAVAKLYKAKIDTIFVGPESELAGGRAFLERLAAASGGHAVTADRVLQLANKVQFLLGA